jgi:hypothetical protein
LLSVTVTSTGNGLPVAVLGVPVIVPVPCPMVRPSGNPVADHLYDPKPPVAVIVVDG